MAILFMDGFDHYTADAEAGEKWTSENLLSMQTSGGRFGGNYAKIGGSGSNLILDYSATASNFCGFAYKYDHLEDGGQRILRILDGVTAQIELSVHQGGGLYVTRQASSVIGDASAGGLLKQSVWAYIEFKWTIGNSGSFEIFVNGKSVAAGVSVDTDALSSAQADSLELKGFNDNDFDDFYFGDTTGGSPQDDVLGDVRIYNLMPTGAGNYAQFDTTFPASPTTHWDKVEEIPPDGDTSYNETTTATDIDTFAMANLP